MIGLFGERRRYRRAIARIRLHGEIVPFARTPVGVAVAADPIRDALDAAADDKRIRAVILDINSPGGTLVASREIQAAAEKFEKPIVAWIRDFGASGAYLVALGADRIVADRFSVVGSVGVILPHLEFSGLLEKIGVRSQTLKAGKFKDLGLPTRPMTDEERGILQARLDEAHAGFIAEVEKKRKLAAGAADEIRTGLAFFGERAKAMGLVDEIGGLDEAIRACEDLGRFRHDKIFFIEPERPPGLLRRLLTYAERLPEAAAASLLAALRAEAARPPELR